MYKLTVVSGPNRGTSYPIHEGENSIGRQSNNGVVLQSAKVSKRHCVLVVENDEIEVRDSGSSNGTFVNGVMTKFAKKLRPGDKIGVGEFVLEIGMPKQESRRAPPAQGFGENNVVQFPEKRSRRKRHEPKQELAGFDSSRAVADPGLVATGPPSPKDLKSRLIWAFEVYVMPFFYGLNMKNDWRLVMGGVFGVFVLMSVVLSVTPLLDLNHESVIREVMRRTKFMAHQIAESNAPHLASNTESKTEIGAVEHGDYVRVAVLTDLDNRIIAPAGKINQHLASGLEARLATRAAAAFRSGLETGIVKEVDDTTVVAIEPVKVFKPQLGKNVAVAMAIVSVDTSLATIAAGEVGTVYSKALILSGALAVLVFFIIQKLTVKPFLVLNEDMDKVLKGEMGQVTHEFKFEELDALWDIINASLQRIPRGGAPGSGGGGAGDSGIAAEDVAAPISALASLGNVGIVVLNAERKVVQLNTIFEEISGIRPEVAMGQELGSVARDQSMGAFLSDLMDRAQAGSEGSSESFDFSGISCKVHVVAFGRPPEPPKCFVVAVVKNA